jgi:hypothetical protein
MVEVEMFTTALIEFFKILLKERISLLLLGSLCMGLLGAFSNSIEPANREALKRVESKICLEMNILVLV